MLSVYSLLFTLAAPVIAQSSAGSGVSDGLFTFGPTATTSRENTPAASGLGYTPLNRKVIPYSEIPEKVDTAAWGRGPQSGTNICNETTAGETSQCQTAIVNSIEDFCLYGLPALANVGDTEAAAVTYCTNSSHGGRPIAAGSIYQAQFTYFEQYVQITGLIDQTKLNIIAGDYGGELDPVGADYRGNPLGGLMYSTIFSPNGTLEQIQHWTQFIGSDSFCLRLCQPGSYNATLNCEHIYDRIGCQYNMPHTVSNNTFETCYADMGLPVGRYIDSAGILQTYTQPPESLGPITSIPYTPVTPSSSNCSSPTAPPAAFLINPEVSTSAALAATESVPRRALRFDRQGF